MHRRTNASKRQYRYHWACRVGALTLVGFLLPAPLAGQERAVRVQPARQAVELETFDTRTRELLGTPEAERRISSRLTHRDRLVAQRIGEKLRQGASFDEVRGDWEGLVSRSDSKDVDGLLQFVPREAYVDEVDALRQAADRMRRANEQKQALREERARLRERLRQLDAELERMNEDSQLMNIDLQNAQQRMQQTLQMMTNVSKQMHDTAMAILRKM